MSERTDGDVLYKIQDPVLAWVIDKGAVERLPKSREKPDLEFLLSYLAARKTPLAVEWAGTNSIYIEIKKIEEREAISLLVSYHPNWLSKNPDMQLKQDPLGNILLIPNKKIENQTVVLEYKI